MDQALMTLAAASVTFVGTHIVLSHPLREPLIRRSGPREFLMIYSLSAILSFGWMVFAFRAAPIGPDLWNGYANLPWAVASLLTLVGLTLFLGSLIDNPAMPEQSTAGLAQREPDGVFLVTRHPMLWGIILWAIAHMIVAATVRSLIFDGAFLFLALAGAYLQDGKKRRLLGDDWKAWEAKTTLWPRISKLGAPGKLWLVGVIVWLAVTWVHARLVMVPAGIWKFTG